MNDLAQARIAMWGSNGKAISRVLGGLGRRFGLSAAATRLVAITACTFALAGPAAAVEAAMGSDDARHLLARTGFGPTWQEIKAVSAMSREQAVAQLLRDGAPQAAATPAPDWIDEPITPPRAIREMATAERQAYQRKQGLQTLQLRGWWINEMLGTTSPLTERMTLFWHNHFTSSQQKVRYPQLMYRQNLLLREHALGNFATLLHAASKDPAMVVYLDAATNRKGKPNENFAREVMELFTLGEGHYTETDIREAARAFTGWSLELDTAEFRNRPFQHDFGQKTVLGRSGNFDGDAVLDILLSQPRTAEYIVEKMWREFVSPQPEGAEVRRIAAAFRGSGYDIRTALRGLLMSPAFWTQDNRAVLVKSPAEFVVGSLRQFDVPVSNPVPVAIAMAGLGQNLFAPPNVKGWPGGDAWINSSTLLARKQFVERLFRTEERMQPGMESMQGGLPQPVRERIQARLEAQEGQVRANDALRRVAPQPLPMFESRRWLSAFPGDRDAAIEQVVLAAAPANPVPQEVAGREWLRHLAMDPVYQLK